MAIDPDVLEHKVNKLKEVLGKGYDTASNQAVAGTWEQFSTLLQVLYLKDVLSAEDIKDILAAEEIF